MPSGELPELLAVRILSRSHLVAEAAMTQRYLPAIPFAALCFLSAQSHPQIAAKAKKTRSTGRSWASRLVSSGVRILLASMATLDTAQAVKHHYAQVLITHRQPPQVSQDKLIGVDQSHPSKRL